MQFRYFHIILENTERYLEYLKKNLLIWLAYIEHISVLLNVVNVA